MPTIEKRPRHYIQEILDEGDREKRRELLAKVPKEFREWVQNEVKRLWPMVRK